MNESLPPPPPVSRHLNWKSLISEFRESYPQMIAAPSGHLAAMLAPAASAAWWLATFRPDILARPFLHIVLPGASYIESLDEGRWFNFFGWLLGRPQTSVRVTLVGDELGRTGVGSDLGLLAHVPTSHLATSVATPNSALVAHLPPAPIYDGTLGKWLRSNSVPDALILFSPGFEVHCESWLQEIELTGLMRKGVPIGAFSYSRMDGMTDKFILKAHGITGLDDRIDLNPFCLKNEVTSAIGCYAQFGWNLQARTVPNPLTKDEEMWAAYEAVSTYMKAEFEREGGDSGFERLGDRISVADGEALIILPYSYACLESNGLIGSIEEDEFLPLFFTLYIPPDELNRRPTQASMERIIWALETFDSFVEPKLEDDTNTEMQPMSIEDAEQGIQALLKELTGEDIDAKAYMNEIRIQGGLHGATHPSWHDLLSSLGWAPSNYNSAPNRFEPAFTVESDRGAMDIPVICEAYGYLPDDNQDTLAKEAMQTIERAYPRGAMVLYKAMPFTIVDDRNYAFGGMLLWKSRWRPFALNRVMTCFDSILKQLDDGFCFGTPMLQYADEGLVVTVPIARMCFGLDPNEEGQVATMSSGKWHTVIPG